VSIHRPIIAPLYPPIFGPRAGGLPWDRSIGGGAPAVVWTPTVLSGCVLDCIADASQITIVGGKVSQWNDRSSQANHLTQGTAGVRPTVGADAFAAGKDGVVFALASTTHLDKASFAGLGSASPEVTIAYAIEWVGDPGSAAQSIYALDSGSGSWEVRTDAGNGKARTILGAVTSLQATGDLSGSRHRYIARRSNVSTNTVMVMRDGVDSTVAGTLTAMTGATPTFTMGGRLTALPADVKVRAFTIFNRALTDPETLLLDAYLVASMA
jgi:hypothetical protein